MALDLDPACRWIDQEAAARRQLDQAAAALQLIGGVPTATGVVDERAGSRAGASRGSLVRAMASSPRVPVAAFSRRRGRSLLTSNPNRLLTRS
jgi:hypothetical protein